MDDQKVAHFMGLTGLSTAEAANLLEAAGGDLSLAAQLHFDALKEDGDAGADDNDKDEGGRHGGGGRVRAPIAPSTARLQDSDYDYHDGPRAARPATVLPQPFAQNSAENPQSERAARLAQLYRPPLELMHDPPTWDAARASARIQRRPLLLSLLDPTVFACHVANRDIWSQPAVQSFVRANCVFLQLAVTPRPDDLDLQGSDHAGGTEGDVYMARYRVGVPHVGVIDSMTGELLHSFAHTHAGPGAIVPSLGTVEDFLAQLADVLHQSNASYAPILGPHPSSPQGSISFPDPMKGQEESNDGEAGNGNEVGNDDDMNYEEELRAEPSRDGPDTTVLMFRLSDGTRRPRHFRLDDTLDHVHRVAEHLVMETKPDKRGGEGDEGQGRGRVRLGVGPQHILERSTVTTIRAAKLANSLVTVFPP